LAAHLGLDRFHVAGGSGGGPYALACAIRSPTRVLSATLFSSGVPPEAMHSSEGKHSANKNIFFLAKYAPLLMRALFALQAHALRKHPSPETQQKYMTKMRSKMCEWDRRILEKQDPENMMLML
jgi:pimeloyl-ACP methyl ester carboxylesterase